tara:strand:- start:598 stop:834 length:237 start_codon:yes stop_codon:yes gene_type:complete
MEASMRVMNDAAWWAWQARYITLHNDIYVDCEIFHNRITCLPQNRIRLYDYGQASQPRQVDSLEANGLIIRYSPMTNR